MQRTALKKIRCAGLTGILFILTFSMAQAGEPGTADPHQSDATPVKPLDEAASDQSYRGEESKNLRVTSLDFMENDSPLTSEEIEKAIELAESQMSREKSTEPRPEKPRKTPRFKENDWDTATTFPIQESCANTEIPGESICQKKYSDGSTAEIRIHDEKDGMEQRQLTLVIEFGPERQIRSEKSIYQGTQFKDTSLKQKEFEFFEIEYKPVSGTSSKEVLIYDFHADSGNIRKVTWAQYETQEDEEEMTLVSHAFLTYEKDGTPKKGLAESLEDGFLTAQFLSWNDRNISAFGSSEDSWKSWENWITSRRIGFYVS